VLLPLLIDVERIGLIAMLVRRFQLKSPAVNGDAPEAMIDGQLRLEPHRTRPDLA
jgi:hypothetical protein